MFNRDINKWSIRGPFVIKRYREEEKRIVRKVKTNSKQ